MLFLTCHLPWPPISGGRRRELELIRRIAHRFDVHLITVSKTPEQDRGNAGVLEELCAVEVFAAEPSVAGRASGDAPAAVLRHRSPAATARVAALLAQERFDLVHVEGFYLMQHVPRWVEPPVLLVEQNVEYELERQRIEAVGAEVGEAAPSSRSPRTEKEELACWARATALGAVTAEDQATMSTALPSVPVALLPDGADHIPSVSSHPPEPAPDRPGGPLAVFLANFAYEPNVDAARHLCLEIVPLLRRAVPDLQTWLVGNAPPPELRALESAHVHLTGYVPAVLPYLDAADVAVCPLRIGGGIKVKTIEALRRGKATVSTAIGAQGLPGTARDALVVVDRPKPFAAAVGELLRSSARRDELQRRAARAGERLPGWDQAAERLGETYDELLSERASAPVAGLAGGASA